MTPATTPTALRRPTGDPDAIAGRLAPLVRLELASIGAIESAAPREEHPGYVVLLHATKMSKQASVEQMNTVLRMAGRREVESGGLIEPVLHLQALALQKAGLTSMLRAMRAVEAQLVARYAAAAEEARGVERRALEQGRTRATKHRMLLDAHLAVRREHDGAPSLPFPIGRYLATELDRVCMRCLLDRPGERGPLRKEDPHTYVCAACHDETVASFPPDLQAQMPRWTPDAWRDRVIHKALGRPSVLRAIKEVHAELAGLPPSMPLPAATHAAESPPAPRERHHHEMPASDISLPREGASEEELAYTDLLFDFRSVRRSW